jgi:hypothetical protein
MTPKNSTVGSIITICISSFFIPFSNAKYNIPIPKLIKTKKGCVNKIENVVTPKK